MNSSRMTELSSVAQDNPKWFGKVASHEEYWIERARVNPVEFITYMTDGEKSPAPHHIDWIRHIFNYDIRNLIIEAFPGAAKTTCIVYSLAWIIGKCPYLTHMLCSVSEEQATQRLTELREIIQSPRYQNVFPHIHMDMKRQNNAAALNIWSSLWKDGSTTDYGRYRALVAQTSEPRDHTVFACGITSKAITGKRINGFIFVDDPHNETNSATPEQREKVTAAIKKELMSRFPARTSPYAKIVIIMTPWAEDDCAGRLMRDKRLDGSNVWVLIKFPVLDKDGNPAWSVMTIENVEDIKAEKGEIIFNLMYMLIETAMAGSRITLDMMRHSLPDKLPEFRDIVIAMDTSKTSGTSSDWNVIIAVARDKEKYFNSYFLMGKRFKDDNVARKVDTFMEFCDDVMRFYGRLDRVLVEDGDTKAEASMIRELRPDIPLIQVVTKGDKEIRFSSYAGFVQQGRFYYNQSSPIMAAIISETIGFPKAAYDDCVDPFSLLFQQSDWSSRKKKATVDKIRSPFML